jgi:hypothetical protein
VLEIRALRRIFELSESIKVKNIVSYSSPEISVKVKVKKYPRA